MSNKNVSKNKKQTKIIEVMETRLQSNQDLLDEIELAKEWRKKI